MKTLSEALDEFGVEKKRAIDRAVEIFKGLADEGDLGYISDVVDVLAELTDILWSAEEEVEGVEWQEKGESE